MTTGSHSEPCINWPCAKGAGHAGPCGTSRDELSSKTLLDQLREELEKRAFHPGEWNEIKHIMYCDFCHYSREYIERAGHADGCILKPSVEPSARQCNHGAVSPKGTMFYHGFIVPKANMWRCDVCKGVFEGNLTEPGAIGSQALTLVSPRATEPPTAQPAETTVLRADLGNCREPGSFEQRMETFDRVVRTAQPPNCTHPFARLGIDADGVMWCTECFAKPLVIPPPFGEGSVTKEESR
jgi:hypothetical protein